MFLPQFFSIYSAIFQAFSGIQQSLSLNISTFIPKRAVWVESQFSLSLSHGYFLSQFCQSFRQSQQFEVPFLIKDKSSIQMIKQIQYKYKTFSFQHFKGRISWLTVKVTQKAYPLLHKEMLHLHQQLCPVLSE